MDWMFRNKRLFRKFTESDIVIKQAAALLVEERSWKTHLVFLRRLSIPTCSLIMQEITFCYGRETFNRFCRQTFTHHHHYQYTWKWKILRWQEDSYLLLSNLELHQVRMDDLLRHCITYISYHSFWSYSSLLFIAWRSPGCMDIQ